MMRFNKLLIWKIKVKKQIRGSGFSVLVKIDPTMYRSQGDWGRQSQDSRAGFCDSRELIGGDPNNGKYRGGGSFSGQHHTGSRGFLQRYKNQSRSSSPTKSFRKSSPSLVNITLDQGAFLSVIKFNLGHHLRLDLFENRLHLCLIIQIVGHLRIDCFEVLVAHLVREGEHWVEVITAVVIVVV